MPIGIKQYFKNKENLWRNTRIKSLQSSVRLCHTIFLADFPAHFLRSSMPQVGHGDVVYRIINQGKIALWEIWTTDDDINRVKYRESQTFLVKKKQLLLVDGNELQVWRRWLQPSRKSGLLSCCFFNHFKLLWNKKLHGKIWCPYPKPYISRTIYRNHEELD